MKITEGVYQVDDVPGGPAVLVADGYVSVVDTGVPNSEGKILALIESLGRQPRDVNHILITHSDPDHIGSLPALVEATGATVYAQRDEAEVIQGTRPSRGGQVVTKPVEVEQMVRDGDVLPIHGGIQVVESFGHTTGHVCYYLLEQKLLLVGDCMVNADGLQGSYLHYTANMEQANDTVKKLAALLPPPELLVFGHGAPMVGGATEQIKRLADSL
ncbi:MAG: MBL fold metallo-hydrolase [Chloroflexi bacterium]|nr:MBL fold metallo-hydrolase [Chloroflexota bacterium]